MRTAYVTTPPGVTQELSERRQTLGHDRRDEVRVGGEEPLIVGSGPRTVEGFARGADGFVAADGSAVPGITSEGLAPAIDRPA